MSFPLIARGPASVRLFHTNVFSLTNARHVYGKAVRFSRLRGLVFQKAYGCKMELQGEIESTPSKEKRK
jgi:hypothetical protein